MLTAKGNTYATLLDMDIIDTVLTVRIKLTDDKLGDLSKETIAKAIPFIQERINTDKKPGATFKKELGRIELHREQLKDAFLNLWNSYTVATTPQSRQSSAEKAQLEMFKVMGDKLLRQFANGVLNGKADDFVLPEERQRLIDATMAAMKNVGE